ncbi:uncharacterized protein HMPREF1541_03973 [Cyphellophora europaea CBS 101466]|uniref:SURF1-like protein n=1 Tax=Cyphellophora europaea (strain CBS 101466) TaxID=1220924 RepID=W2S254_CYPE1|nr:uncharacterized protein HMPREF1541_03973 [Cyphellophora europaea CBS 101466]ETN42034.1 hypothetical protein HMPREF1541_03973 [Cyphellophora europaea CBS 101466]
MSRNDLKVLQAILSTSRTAPRAVSRRIAPRLRRNASTSSRPPAKSAEDPNFISIVDAPPRLVSTKRRTTKLGVAALALIPFTAFCLGTWQVQRLDWKTKLVAKFEDRLVRPPLPLPPRLDPDAIHDFDYRRVYATGKLRHDKEMLIGPRMHDGQDGFQVVTPLEREDGSTILVNRGWISREKQFHQDRDPSSLPTGQITVAGLLREPWKKNWFTPENKPAEGKFFFPDVYQMAAKAGCEPVWIEETMQPSLLESYDREAKGRPIGRAAEVNLRNNHAQYIFTWYSLCAATSLMMWMVLKRKPSDLSRRVRHTTNW